MNRITLFIIFFSISLSHFSQANEKIKFRKLNYKDFKKLSINDTSDVIIDIFYDKKDNTAIGQMSFLPITVAIFIISPPISVGLTTISFPVFLHGGYVLIKYRKKKLYDVLTVYQTTNSLPKWIRKKANKQLARYEMIKSEY